MTENKIFWPCHNITNVPELDLTHVQTVFREKTLYIYIYIQYNIYIYIQDNIYVSRPYLKSHGIIYFLTFTGSGNNTVPTDKKAVAEQKGLVTYS